MSERRIADELQTALLPSAEVEPEELDVATYYRAWRRPTSPSTSTRWCATSVASSS